MKSNLTWEEFLKAYELLVTDKQPEPGIHKLYKHLGKGSVSTISKYKKRLQELRKNAIPLNSGSLPDPISTAAIKLFNEMTTAIDEKEKLLDEDVQKRYQEIEDTLKALNEKNQRADDTIEQLQEKQSAANDTIEKLKSEQHDQELKLTEANSKIESLAIINVETNKAANALKEEYAARLMAEQDYALDVKKQLTELQHDKKAADEKHAQQIESMKQQHQGTTQALKDEITKLNLFYACELKDKESRLTVLQEQHTETEERLAASLVENSKHESLQKKLQKTLDDETKRADKIQDKVVTISQSLSQANETIAEIKSEKKDLLLIMKKIKPRTKK